MRPLRTVVLVALAVASTVGGARAAPEEGADARASAVAVLRPAQDDPVLLAAAARTQLELGAAGVRSALIDAGDGYAARVAFVREDGVATIDILATPAVGPQIYRRVAVPREAGGDDAAVLAVRAVEILRGIRLEVRRPQIQAHRPETTTEAATETTTPALAPESATWRFELGLGTLMARPLGATLGFGPVAAAAAAIAPQLSVAVTFAGPFSTERPGTPDGTADTREELGAIGLRADTRAARLAVHVLGAVGLHHASARYDTRGVGPMPRNHPALLVMKNQSVWNPLMTLAAGASWRVSSHWGVSLQCAALLVQPALDLVVNDQHVGTLGGPSLLTTLSAWAGI